MKPYLKYLGNKMRQEERICSLFSGPPAGRYIEPFAGSCAVFLARAARGELEHATGAVLADTNAKVIACHAAIRDHVDATIASLQALPWGNTWRPSYRRVVDLYNRQEKRTGPFHAATYIWLNRAGFNGMYRENKKGEFNIPPGSYPEIKPPDEDHLRGVSRLFGLAEIVTSDFEAIVDDAKKGDQIYADPPFFPVSKTSSFTGYDKSGFGPQEQERLAKALARAVSRGVEVVASNADVEDAKSLYGELGFNFDEVPVKRTVSAKKEGRRNIKELLFFAETP